MNKYELIMLDEGFRSSAYHCSEGYVTIGYGKRIGDYKANLGLYQFTIPEPAARAWLVSDVDELEIKLNAHDWFLKLNESRKAIIISMCYQLGVAGFSKFKKTIEYLKQEKYSLAACEMLDSKWSSQTPKRAKRYSNVMAGGSLSIEYN